MTWTTILGTGLLLCGCGPGGTGAAVHPPPATYELLFDGAAADGSRLLWHAPLDGGPAQVLGMTYQGTRPSPRPDGRATAGDRVRRLIRPGADYAPAWWRRP